LPQRITSLLRAKPSHDGWINYRRRLHCIWLALSDDRRRRIAYIVETGTIMVRGWRSTESGPSHDGEAGVKSLTGSDSNP
jgi:hypothetical protein